MTVETHQTGLAWAERYGVSVREASLAASALDADGDTLWSEDMQDRLSVEGRLKVRNPFARVA